MKKKKYIVIGLILILLLIGVGITYAWYVWQSNDDEVKTISATVGAARVIYVGGSQLTGDIMPVSDMEDGIIKNITISAIDKTSYDLTFSLYLDILEMDDIFKHESFKYAIYKNNTKVKEGNFTETFEECTLNNTTHIVLFEGQKITTSADKYTLYLWIDGNMNNPSGMQRKNISFKLHAYGENATKEDPSTLIEYISNIYNDAEKTTITNNGINYYQTNIYNVDADPDTSGGLMNDRLGGMTSDYNAGNIRYYGTNPSNYIDIGDTEINSDGEEITTLYRIIGLFKDITVVNEDGTTTTKDLVKVIRNDNIGNYAWDNKTSGIGTSNSSSGSNNWADARLMMLLNPGYDDGLIAEDGDVMYANKGSLYWNSDSGECYSGQSNATTPCDFKTLKTGLSTDAQSKIETVVWNLKGWNSYDIYSNAVYNYERTTGSVYNNKRATTWPGKVAVMYPSDYGYATDLSATVCSSSLYDYKTSANSYGCRSNNWIYNKTFTQWTLTPNSGSSNMVFIIYSSGYLNYVNSYFPMSVRPTFYLDSELLILSGSGTQNNPYVVG